MSTSDLSEDVPLTVTTPDGNTTVIAKADDGTDSGDQAALYFVNTHFYDETDTPGCMYFYASTRGKKSDDFFMLSLTLKKESLAKGVEAEAERVIFCRPFSSYSGHYTDSYTGHIYLKERRPDQVTLRFDKVSFEIASGTYILNGDLTFYPGPDQNETTF